MNAELPAFDPNQVDPAFAAALEEDGLPPLYPNQPRWAFEDGHGAEREAFAQRRSDAAFAHVKLLARRHRGKKQPPGDWRSLLATAGLRPSEPTSKIFTDTEDADLRRRLHGRVGTDEPARLRARRRRGRAAGGAVLRLLWCGHALCVRVWCVLLLARLSEGGVARARAVVRCGLPEWPGRLHDAERAGIW
jgi:hypothetical protein